jgi:hypothetical protein
MDYSKLSDFEINELVAKVAGVSHETYPDFSPEPYVWNEDAKAEFDPCNNPADAWPIIADKKICLAFDVFAEPQDGGGWVASPAYGWESERVRHDNPLRAAMILFLKMQESANVPANPTGTDLL